MLTFFLILALCIPASLSQTTGAVIEGTTTPYACTYEAVPGDTTRFRLITNPTNIWNCTTGLVFKFELCTCDYSSDPATPIRTCDKPALISLLFEGDTKDSSCTGAWINAINKLDYVSGKVGQAAVFSQGSRIQIDYYTSRFNGNVEPFSVSFWIKSRLTFLKKTIINYGGCLQSSDSVFEVVIENDGSFSVNLKTSNDIVGTVAGGAAIPDTFTHVAVSYNLLELTLFVDGVLIDTTSLNGGMKNSPNCPMIVSGIDTLDMNADIDQLRFYKIGLSGSEVTDLINEV